MEVRDEDVLEDDMEVEAASGGANAATDNGSGGAIAATTIEPEPSKHPEEVTTPSDPLELGTHGDPICAQVTEEQDFSASQQVVLLHSEEGNEEGVEEDEEEEGEKEEETSNTPATPSQWEDGQRWDKLLLSSPASPPSSLVRSLPCGQRRKEEEDKSGGAIAATRDPTVEEEEMEEEEKEEEGGAVPSQVSLLGQLDTLGSDTETDEEDVKEVRKEEEDFQLPSTPDSSQESLPLGQGTPPSSGKCSAQSQSQRKKRIAHPRKWALDDQPAGRSVEETLRRWRSSSLPLGPRVSRITRNSSCDNAGGAAAASVGATADTRGATKAKAANSRGAIAATSGKKGGMKAPRSAKAVSGGAFAATESANAPKAPTHEKKRKVSGSEVDKGKKKKQ